MPNLSLMSEDRREDSDLSELSLAGFDSFPRTPPDNGYAGLVPSNLLIPDLDDTSTVPAIGHFGDFLCAFVRANSSMMLFMISGWFMTLPVINLVPSNKHLLRIWLAL